MKKTLLALPLVAVLTLTGCSGLTTAQQRELSGGAIGAAAGAGITALAHGNPIWGAIGGAAVGVLGGYVYNKHEQGQ
ncbi:MAG: glycine zipper domain-containing protein [Burkholderiaceae bacterium]|jgi:osmotically inducible lipoprotein OsmB|nr:glycine zipper domain-containing protein [Burkholderiaceae bacterium]MDP4970222.1 glycine zipper domain-containing protein [Burkholderiaceae bacterium]MDP5112136.1 glycine zipper domain-containing protein [Burkholderiaceae bacterium]